MEAPRLLLLGCTDSRAGSLTRWMYSRACCGTGCGGLHGGVRVLHRLQGGSPGRIDSHVGDTPGPAAVLDAGTFMVVSMGCADMRGAWNSEAVAAAGHGFVAGLAHGRVPQPDVYTVSPVR